MAIGTQKDIVGELPAKLHSLGGNLYLDVNSATSRQWVFIYKRGGRQRSKGLGSATGSGGPKITLAEARKRAERCRAMLADGLDPLAEEKRQTTLLGSSPDSYVKSIEVAFRSPKTATNWRLTFDTHAAAIRNIPVASVTSADILAVLQPIWGTRREMAQRLRHRLERVLRIAKAAGLRSGDNPATLENLGLPKHKKRGQVRHHPAMPYEDIPAFMATLKNLNGPGSLALQLLILTATRSAEALGARWDEIDLQEQVWTIPANRVKNGEKHVVPLTPEMLTLLERIAVAWEGGGSKENRLFPGSGHNAMLQRLKRIPGCSTYTVHGFRSSFRDWCGNETAFPRDVVEETYGHEVGSNVERAYRRHKAMKKRREVLGAWNRYATGSATVLP